MVAIRSAHGPRRRLYLAACLIALLDSTVPVHAIDSGVTGPLELAGAAHRVPRLRTAGNLKSSKSARQTAHRHSSDAKVIVPRSVKTFRVDPTPVSVSAEPQKAPVADAAKRETIAASPPGPSGGDIDVKAFCGNVGRAASDARMAWQAAKVAELEAALKQRMSEYEMRVTEAREWLTRRDDAMRRADDMVVAIYAKMRPDAAASQLASLDDALASAVLMKLSPRAASAILGEIPSDRAARLTDVMTGRNPAGVAVKKPS